MFRKAFTSELGDTLFSPAQTLPLLRAAWPLAVGGRLAERTEPVALQGRALIVRVADARWQRILHRLRREILGKLRAAAGSHAPAALGFVESPLRPAPSVERARESPRVVAAEPPALVVAEAARIADEQVRTRFLETAARYLSRSAAI